MSLRIVFFGTPLSAVPSLERLVESGLEVISAVTAPDKPQGRRRIVSESPVASAARRLGLPCLKPVGMRDTMFREQIAELAPDLCVIVVFGRLIPADILSIPRKGFVNLHPSLLPLWRGPSPIQSSLLAGDAATGISIMLLDDEMDHGPILAQQSVPIETLEHLPELTERLAHLGSSMLVSTIIDYADGTIVPTVQDHASATYCKKFIRDDARIDWSNDARSIVNMIRAFSGEPTAWTMWNGTAVNIYRTAGTYPDGPAPAHVGVVQNDLVVGARNGAVRISELQSAGRRKLPAPDFLKGSRSIIGSVLH